MSANVEDGSFLFVAEWTGALLRMGSLPSAELGDLRRGDGTADVCWPTDFSLLDVSG